MIGKQDEQGVFQLREEVKKAQMEEAKTPEKITEEKEKLNEFFIEIGDRESLKLYLQWFDDGIVSFKERLKKDIVKKRNKCLRDAIEANIAAKSYLQNMASRVENGENIRDIIEQERKLMESQGSLTDRAKKMKESMLKAIDVAMKVEARRKEDNEKE